MTDIRKSITGFLQPWIRRSDTCAERRGREKSTLICDGRAFCGPVRFLFLLKKNKKRLNNSRAVIVVVLESRLEVISGRVFLWWVLFCFHIDLLRVPRLFNLQPRVTRSQGWERLSSVLALFIDVIRREDITK